MAHGPSHFCGTGLHVGLACAQAMQKLGWLSMSTSSPVITPSQISFLAI